MKTILILVSILAGTLPARAQLMIGGQASYLHGDKQQLWGGGAQFKLLIGKRIAVGAIVRSYPREFTETSFNGATIRSANAITPVAGSLEYYFGKGNGLQPYLGVDAGLYLHRMYTQAVSNNIITLNQDEGQTYFGIAPKVGLLFKSGGLVAPFIQAQYHTNFGSGDGDDITIPGVNAPWQSKGAASFTTVDAGILLRLKAAGR